MGESAVKSKNKKHTYLWLIDADVWQGPTQGCTAIILRFKNTKFPEYSISALECFYLDIS